MCLLWLCFALALYRLCTGVASVEVLSALRVILHIRWIQVQAFFAVTSSSSSSYLCPTLTIPTFDPYSVQALDSVDFGKTRINRLSRTRITLV